MNLADFVQPRKPVEAFANTLEGQYWLQNGVVRFRSRTLADADAHSFQFFLGGYAVDQKHCYCGAKKMKADRATFEVLNYTYTKDKENVWAMGVRIPTADAATFTVCDDGAYYYLSGGDPVWHGYGKDKNGVYYYDCEGKPKLLKKADPATFVSLGDKIFGKDANHVFYYTSVLPKADPATWGVIAGAYSRDAKRVFNCKDALPAAVDPQKFEVLLQGEAKFRAGHDGSHYFYFDMPITKDEYDQLAGGQLDWTVLAGRLNQRNSEA
jgi:hypothetical protein